MKNKENRISQKVTALIQLRAETVVHSRDDLLNHLISTCLILQDMGATELVCDAGLFHSVYSTNSFGFELIDRNSRDLVRTIIGIEAENLVYLYCAKDEVSFSKCIKDFMSGSNGSFLLMNRFTTNWERISFDDLEKLIVVSFSNYIEQAFRMFDNQSLDEFLFWNNLTPFLPPKAQSYLDKLKLKFFNGVY